MFFLELLNTVSQFKNKTFRELQEIFLKLSQGQNPNTLFITCSDSRIIPSSLTQTQPGDLFIVRNVGNIVPPYPALCSEAAAIEYAVNVLHVKDIIICGHSKCGAMQGLLTPSIQDTLPLLANWLNYAQNVLKKMNEIDNRFDINPALQLQTAIELNIKNQMEHLQTYPNIADKLKQNQIRIHGWYYKIETGEVFAYETNTDQFVSIEEYLMQEVKEKIEKITSSLAMQHLKTIACPKTASDYLKLMHLLNALQFNIKPIWHFIKPQVVNNVWQELSFLFTDRNDDTFNRLINNTSTIELKDLKCLQMDVQNSPGYHAYCQQLMVSSSRFFNSALPKTAENQTPYSSKTKLLSMV